MWKHPTLQNQELCKAMETQGVKMNETFFGKRYIRAITHSGVTESDIDLALKRIKIVLESNS
jgi:hypothetical protein